MFFHGFRVNQNVIKVDNNSFVQKIKKDTMHNTLESAGRIAQTERQYKVFKGTVPTSKRGFMAVFHRYRYLVVRVV